MNISYRILSWTAQSNHLIVFQSLSPGVTTTDIFDAGGFKDDYAYRSMPAVKSEDISNAVLYLLSTPHYVNVTELTIKHVSQKF